MQLNSGEKIPVIGLGTSNAKGEQIYESIKTAIDVGYRHIDTAFVYENELEIGKTLGHLFKKGHCTRNELFITTKLWGTFYRSDLVRSACLQSLNNLQLDYIDLYLMHTPCALKEDTNELRPRDNNHNVVYSDVNFIDTWLEMKKLRDEKLVKSIGVSNFNIEQLEQLVGTGIIPAVLQIECHPFLTQTKLLAFCNAHGIHVTAHSPLGSSNRLIGFAGEPKLLADEQINRIAQINGKTAAQIVIRYQIQNGNSVIPKSVHKHRIIENFNVFDFELNSDDMKTLDKLNFGRRFCALIE